METFVLSWSNEFVDVPDGLSKKLALQLEELISQFLARKRIEVSDGVAVDVIFRSLRWLESDEYEAIDDISVKREIIKDTLCLLAKYHPYGQQIDVKLLLQPAHTVNAPLEEFAPA